MIHDWLTSAKEKFFPFFLLLVFLLLFWFSFTFSVVVLQWKVKKKIFFSFSSHSQVEQFCNSNDAPLKMLYNANRADSQSARSSQRDNRMRSASRMSKILRWRFQRVELCEWRDPAASALLQENFSVSVFVVSVLSIHYAEQTNHWEWCVTPFPLYLLFSFCVWISNK